jgi:hypothetical protein
MDVTNGCLSDGILSCDRQCEIDAPGVNNSIQPGQIVALCAINWRILITSGSCLLVKPAETEVFDFHEFLDAVVGAFTTEP